MQHMHDVHCIGSNLVENQVVAVDPSADPGMFEPGKQGKSERHILEFPGLASQPPNEFQRAARAGLGNVVANTQEVASGFIREGDPHYTPRSWAIWL